MKSEDFESKMRDADPARDLTKLTESELQQIAVSAIAAEPAATKTRKSYGKGLVAAAVAALIAVPALNGALTADSPPIISLGSANEITSGAALESAPQSYRDSKMSADAMYWWGAYKFQLADGVVVDDRTGTGYEIQARSDAEQIIRAFARELGVTGLDYSNGKDTLSTDPDDYESPRIYGYLDGSSASVDYFNPELDVWATCYSVVEGSEDGSGASETSPVNPDGTCEPETASDLPTETEAKAIANEFFNSVGLSVSGLDFEYWADDYNVYISFFGGNWGYDYYSMGLVDGGEIYSVYASLTEKVALGEYDLVDAQAAIDRANEQADRYIKQMEEDGVYNTMPFAEGDISTPEPAPGDGDVYEAPEFEVKTVVVTDIKLVWSMHYSDSGASLLLPTYEFYGYVDGESSDVTEYSYHSIIAIVDEQIDLDSFFGYGGVGYAMPMAKDSMVRMD